VCLTATAQHPLLMKRTLLALLLLPGLLVAAVSEDPVVTKLRAKANEGMAGAQHNLAEMLANGYGVQKDPVEAAGWYRKSAEQGYGEAQFSLALVYLKGAGLPKDETEGLAWVNVAAKTGNVTLVKFREKLELQLGPKVVAAAQERSKELLRIIAANKRAKAGK